MEGTPNDHAELLDAVVAALNAPDSGPPSAIPDAGPLREVATQAAWEHGGFGKLWRLRRDGYTFSAAGVLAPHGRRTLGCVRYRQPSQPQSPARSVFVLLTEREGRQQVAGVYADTPLAVAWLRGWIDPGQRLDALPSTEEGRELAQALADAPRHELTEVLAERLGVGDEDAARIARELPPGPLVVLGVHSLEAIGRTLFGLGVDGDEPARYREGLWFVVEHGAAVPAGVRLVSVLARPSLTMLLTGARGARGGDDAGGDEVDLFIERLTAVVREAKDNEARDVRRERFRQELTERLESAFERAAPSDHDLVEAFRRALAAGAERGQSLGRLVAEVLARIADAREQNND